MMSLILSLSLFDIVVDISVKDVIDIFIDDVIDEVIDIVIDIVFIIDIVIVIFSHYRNPKMRKCILLFVLVVVTFVAAQTSRR